MWGILFTLIKSKSFRVNLVVLVRNRRNSPLFFCSFKCNVFSSSESASELACLWYWPPSIDQHQNTTYPGDQSLTRPAWLQQDSITAMAHWFTMLRWVISIHDRKYFGLLQQKVHWFYIELSTNELWLQVLLVKQHQNIVKGLVFTQISLS